MSTTATVRTRAIAPSDLAYIAVFAALIAALALTPPIPIGALGVPITLQTLGVALAGMCLGAWRGAAAVGLYLLVGLAGLPVFSGGRAGLAVLVGPTGGYLLAFVPAAFVTGLVAQWAVRRGLSRVTPVFLFLGSFAARVLIVWPLGVLGISRAVGTPVGDLWLSDLAFWPGDIIKGVIAAGIAFAVHKAFPRLLAR